MLKAKRFGSCTFYSFYSSRFEPQEIIACRGETACRNPGRRLNRMIWSRHAALFLLASSVGTHRPVPESSLLPSSALAREAAGKSDIVRGQSGNGHQSRSWHEVPPSIDLKGSSLQLALPSVLPAMLELPVVFNTPGAHSKMGVDLSRMSEDVGVFNIAYNKTKVIVYILPSGRGADSKHSGGTAPKLGDPNTGSMPLADQLLLALGGGTGALRGASGVHDHVLDQDIRRRMRYQDKAVLVMLLIVYLTTIGVGASLTYRQSCNDSPVLYYAKPQHHHDLMTEDAELPGFLEAFTQVPKDVLLQVTGFTPMLEQEHDSVDWNGRYYRVAFDFALDLSPWVSRARGTGEAREGEELIDGMLAEDQVRLSHFLQYNQNDLATVEVRKDVAWLDWEELATNLKNQIRQKGFDGIISARRCDVEPVVVCKNRPWSNFLHNRMTKVFCALSIVGGLVYIPYVWLRSSKLVVRVRYKIELPIAQYWSMIVDQLGAHGFQADASVS